MHAYSIYHKDEFDRLLTCGIDSSAIEKIYCCDDLVNMYVCLSIWSLLL